MGKIAVISDSPTITSGFGVANRAIIDALQTRGHEVQTLGVLETRTVFDGPYKIWPVYPNDPLGFHRTAEFLQTFKPDLIFLHGDPGTLYQRLGTLHFFIKNVPIVALYPIEGAPVHDTYIDLSKRLHAQFCYTETGAQLIELGGGVKPQVQYLGYDPDIFSPLDEKIRQHIRNLVGFQDAFLVSNHAFNKRGNRQPALIKAASMLLDTNVLFYLHTHPQEDSGLQGWDLEMTRRQYGASNVLFRPETNPTYHGVSFTDSTPDEHYLTIERPDTIEGRKELFHKLPIRIRYAIADLYLDPSSVQGFNLPTVEAAACGVPIVSVDDGLARSELFHQLACWMFHPDAVDYWHNGSELQLVSPEQIADVVLHFALVQKTEPELYQKYRDRSLKEAQRFQWNVQPLISEIERQLEAPTAPHTAMGMLSFGG